MAAPNGAFQNVGSPGRASVHGPTYRYGSLLKSSPGEPPRLTRRSVAAAASSATSKCSGHNRITDGAGGRRGSGQCPIEGGGNDAEPGGDLCCRRAIELDRGVDVSHLGCVVTDVEIGREVDTSDGGELTETGAVDRLRNERASPAASDSTIRSPPATRTRRASAPNSGVPKPPGVTRNENRPVACCRALATTCAATRCSAPSEGVRSTATSSPIRSAR